MRAEGEEWRREDPEGEPRGWNLAVERRGGLRVKLASIYSQMLPIDLFFFSAGFSAGKF